MKERIYYSINEKNAKMAHDMMSFNDYEFGTKTEEYKNCVDSAYKLADKIAAKKPKRTEQAYNMAERYSKKMAMYINRDSTIGCMCPSVMISGSGNFPVKKKERQNRAWEENYKFYKETQEIITKMENILTGKEIIKSDDENAIEELKEKLILLKEKQEEMKAVNKSLRKKNTIAGDEELKNMGYSDKEISNLRKPDFCGRIGYPAYALQNNNANIHRIEDRIQNLNSIKEKGTEITENEFFKIKENTETMRLQLFFDEKPEIEIRKLLKSYGFHWSPRQLAWQRQLTDNAKYSLKKMIEKLRNDVVERCSAYDFFTIKDGKIIISEYGYITDNSVTDNPKETSRFIECRNAEILLSEIDEETNLTDIVNETLSEARQYIKDIDDKEFYSKIHNHLKNGACIVFEYKKNLKPGDYILLD